jgi:hypothetical protein
MNRIELYSRVHRLRAKTCSGGSLTEILLRLKEIALSLDDKDTLVWIDYEMHSTEPFYYPIKSALESRDLKISEDVRTQYKNTIEFIGKDLSHRFVLPTFKFRMPKYVNRSNVVPLSELEIAYSKMRIPYYCSSPINVLEESREDGMIVQFPHDEMDKFFNDVSDERFRAYAVNLDLYISPNDIKSILGGVRYKLVDYFDKILRDQPLNLIDVFYQSMEHAYDDVRKIFPRMVGEFEMIHLNIVQDKPENYSVVASACRRILKRFIDAERPPRKREVSPDNHKLAEGFELNRIKEYIEEKIVGTSEEKLLERHFDYLKEIYGLASKGDKKSITRHEAELCSIHTFLFLTEMIRLRNIDNLDGN